MLIELKEKAVIDYCSLGLLRNVPLPFAGDTGWGSR